MAKAIMIAITAIVVLAGCATDNEQPQAVDPTSAAGSPTPKTAEKTTKGADEPACQASPYEPVADEPVVYFYCVNDLSPVPASMSGQQDPVAAIVATYARGPSPEQEEMGYHGGLLPGTKYDIEVNQQQVVVDLHGSSFQLERFLAAGYPINKPLIRALREQTAKDGEVLIDGRSICSLDEECSAP